MIPVTLSATSLQTAEACMARWKAENFDHTPSSTNSAAMVGTACHGALELFVKGVYIDRDYKWHDLDLLIDLYKLSFMQTFGTADLSSEEFLDGLTLVKKWHDRTDIQDEVLSCEVKSSFPIKTSIGPVPFNYIWDRCDRVDARTIKVVDYKTIRLAVSPEQLRTKIQPRSYALAAQIQFPDAEQIKVEFDLMRHDPVGAYFTKEDNAQMYRYLQRSAERIIATPDDNVPETLNPDCKWCIRKANCKTLTRSMAGGTIYSLSPEQIVEKKLEVSSAISALGYLDKELDAAIIKEAEQRDAIEWQTDIAKVEFTSRRTRAISPLIAFEILGPELSKQYGKMNLGELDKVMRSDKITPEQKRKLEDAIYFTWGEPKPKVTLLNPMDEE